MSTFELWITHLRTQFLTSEAFMSNYKIYSKMYVTPWNIYSAIHLWRCQSLTRIWRVYEGHCYWMWLYCMAYFCWLVNWKYDSNYVIFIVTISLDNVFVFKELCCQWPTNLNQLLLTWASCAGVWCGYFLLFCLIILYIWKVKVNSSTLC